MKPATKKIKADKFIAVLLMALMCFSFNSANAQSRGENLDEAKVNAYTLPDPTDNGRWEKNYDG